MKVLHIVGRRNHGKTSLIAEVVTELEGDGVHVGTIKHCGHDHELDTPGKDSFRHREAGAQCAAVITPTIVASFQRKPAGDDPYALLTAAMSDCTLVLIEGDIEGPGPKLEVWRHKVGPEALAQSRDDLIGVVTDDPLDIALPVYPRSDVAALAKHMFDLAEEI